MAEVKPEILVNVNGSRLQYLLDLYRFSHDQFIAELNSSKPDKPILSLSDFTAIISNSQKISLSKLKKIDEIFHKGIDWYLSQLPLPSKEKSSIFFRKSQFNVPLNKESIRVTDQFEQKKFDVLSLCRNINFEPIRTLKHYTTQDNEKIVAKEMLELFIKTEEKLKAQKLWRKKVTDRDQLKNLIAIIESFNVFVFEYAEAHNRKEKVNFTGFFLKPNFIILKKLDEEFTRREIFTLLHEFGHYLLDSEEIDNVSESTTQNESKIENWCHNFAYFMIASHVDENIKSLKDKDPEKINQIYANSYLSKKAIYTRLLIYGNLSRPDYDAINASINDAVHKRQQDKKLQGAQERARLKALGKKPGFSIKPLQSGLFKEVVKQNYFQGSINEISASQYLNVKPLKLEREIYSD